MALSIFEVTCARRWRKRTLQAMMGRRRLAMCFLFASFLFFAPWFVIDFDSELKGWPAFWILTLRLDFTQFDRFGLVQEIEIDSKEFPETWKLLFCWALKSLPFCVVLFNFQSTLSFRSSYQLKILRKMHLQRELTGWSSASESSRMR